MVNTIGFPGLGLGPFKICEYFEVFGLKIHYYGILIALSIILAYLFCSYIGKKEGISSDALLDVVLYGLPSAVVCARIYYVIFEWEQYKSAPLDIFKIWEGGIAIYGAVIGALLSTYIYCRCKKLKTLKLFDIGVFGLLIGQIIGRWGNFINAEAYGGETSLPWRMALYDIGQYVHPTFLYESLWNIGVFLILFVRRKKKSFDGETFLMYITFYGLGRFWIEGLRTDSLYLGGFRVSQLVAALCVIGGITVSLYLHHKNKKNTETI